MLERWTCKGVAEAAVELSSSPLRLPFNASGVLDTMVAGKTDHGGYRGHSISRQSPVIRV